MSALHWLTLLAALEPAVEEDLVAAAAASSRPADCATRSKGWAQALHPKNRRYCHLLSRASSSLGTAPKNTLELAEAAAKIQSSPAAQLLRARAQLRLSGASVAWATLTSAGLSSPESITGTQALHDFAVIATLAGERAVGLDAYRRLVPQARLLSQVRGRRTRMLVEAAMAAMGDSEASLSEAQAYLNLAARGYSYRGGGAFIRVAKALAFSRAGAAARAELDGVSTDHLRVALNELASAPQLPVAAQTALLALSAEAQDPGQAQSLWRRYLVEEPSGPWRRHAKTRLTVLEHGLR